MSELTIFSVTHLSFMRQRIYSTDTYRKYSVCETPSLSLLIQYCLQGAGSGREMLLLTFSSKSENVKTLFPVFSHFQEKVNQ